MKLYVVALAALLPSMAADVDNIQGNATGDPSAPIRMEVFSDFQCPSCKWLHDEELPMIVKDFVITGKVYAIFRYFPLAGHLYGRSSAEFVCAAAQIGKYQQAADVLFAKQSIWSADGKVEEAVASVLTPPEMQKVKTLVKDTTVQSQINRDVNEGLAVPVRGTPTLLITCRLRRYPISNEMMSNYGLLKRFLEGLIAK